MIILLAGENEFAILQEQKRLIEAYLKDNDSFGLERLDGEELDSARLRDAVMQLPFLVSKKLVIISKVFSSKAILDLLQDLIPTIPDDVDVILVDTKADKRTRLYKELLSSKRLHDFPSLKGQALEKWASEYAKELDSSLSSTDARYLVDRVGTNQMLLAREIEKLSQVAMIGRDDINDLTDQSLNSTVFDLLDITFSGNYKRSLELYEKLVANKTDPSQVLALIGWQLQVFALVKYAGEGNSGDIAKKTGLNPYVASKAMGVVRGLSSTQIKNGVRATLNTDIKIKTTSTDPTDAVRVLLLELST